MNIIFDLGGVLLRWEPELLFKENYSDSPLKENLYKLIMDKNLWAEYDRGVKPRSEFVERVGKIGLEESDYDKFLDNICRHLVVKEDVLKIARKLSEGHRLFVLSNMGIVPAMHLIEAYDFWNIFDGVVFSCHTGMIKPEPQIYQHVLEKYSLEPAETIFIDDTLVNIEASSKLGITSIHFKSSAVLEKELESIGVI